MPRILRSKTFHSVFGVCLSLALLVWVFSKVEWSEVGRELKNINYIFLFPAFAVLFVHYLLRAARWGFLLPQQGKTGLRILFDAIMVGAFATFILPLRAGEFVRPYLLSKQSSYSFTSSFVSVVVERFFDLLMVLLSFVLMLAFVPNVPKEFVQGAMLLILPGLVVLSLMIVGSFFPHRAADAAGYCVRILPKSFRPTVQKHLQDFFAGAAVLAKGGRLSWIIGLSVLVWLSSYFFLYTCFWVSNVQAGYWVAVSLGVIVALAVAAPSAPGFIGVYQAGCVAAFALFGLNLEQAVAYSIVSHLFQYIFFVAYGSYALFRYNIKFSELRGAAKPTA